MSANVPSFSKQITTAAQYAIPEAPTRFTQYASQETQPGALPQFFTHSSKLHAMPFAIDQIPQNSQGLESMFAPTKLKINFSSMNADTETHSVPFRTDSKNHTELTAFQRMWNVPKETVELRGDEIV